MALPVAGIVFWLRKTQVGREPLAVAMSGVRLGERVLQLGIDDVRLAAAIAVRSGLSGYAAMAATDALQAARASRAGAQEGAALDIRVAPPDALPFDDSAFDIVVIHNTGGLLTSASPDRRTRMLREVHRVLRHGGRAIVLDAGPRTGLRAVLRRGPGPDTAYETAGGSVTALGAAGFRPVRVLAERDGLRFTEGFRP